MTAGQHPLPPSHAHGGVETEAAALAFNAGNAAFREQRWQDALLCFDAALRQHTGMESAALQRARCLVQLGQQMAARDAFADALRINPANYSAWLEVGHLCREMGAIEQAMLSYQHAIDVDPQRYGAPLSMARVLEQSGRMELGQKAYEHAVRAAASQGVERVREVHRRMAAYRQARGDWGHALQCLLAALQLAATDPQDALSPDDAAELHIDAAECLMHLGHKEQALAALTTASGARRESTLARLAMVSFHKSLWTEAIAVSRRNVELHPQSPTARWNLAYVLNECWQMEEALTVLQQAESLGPMPLARNMRASMAARCGDADTALTQYLALLEEPQADATLAATVAMCSLYSERLPAQEVADLHKRLFAALGEGARSAQSFVRKPLAGRRIRLGLVTPDFHRVHPVNIFMQPLLRALDRSRLEVFVYFNGTAYDEQTHQAHRLVDHWLDTSQLGNAQLARRMDSDGIDLLLDLAGPTNPMRLPLFAQRAAPVQATYLGYPGSTGVPNMDWIIGDAVVTPEGSEALYAERIVRLPGTVFCFAPETSYPLADFGPSHAKRPLTFGSFNNVPKLTPNTLALWAQVLQAVPHSRLLLKAPSLGDASAVREFSKRLQALGVDLGRVEFRGPTPLDDMMAEYADVDIALDPLPYNGGTTSLQALWMGVPVITLRGPRFASRMGASFMSAAGLADWVAEDEAGYLQIAVQKARDRQALLSLKKGLRARLQAAPAWDLDLHARNLEDAIQYMCAQAELQSSAVSVTPGNSTSV